MNDKEKAAASLFAGEGEVRGILRQFDWSSSPLGDPASWPPEMVVLVRQLLNSRFPMWVAWGEALHIIYNDAYSEILLDRHPRAVAQPLTEVWSEIRHRVRSLIEPVLAGSATPLMVSQFDILRHGQIESAWFNFTLTPVLDCANGVSGVLCLITESTLLVGAHDISERQQRAAQVERANQKYLM